MYNPLKNWFGQNILPWKKYWPKHPSPEHPRPKHPSPKRQSPKRPTFPLIYRPTMDSLLMFDV